MQNAMMVVAPVLENLFNLRLPDGSHARRNLHLAGQRTGLNCACCNTPPPVMSACVCSKHHGYCHSMPGISERTNTGHSCTEQVALHLLMSSAVAYKALVHDHAAAMRAPVSSNCCHMEAMLGKLSCL